MKYFCVSDIHGHYDVLIESLQESGWDPDNMGHRLVLIGDLVDRGPQNVEVLEFVHKMLNENKAIFIMGNHDVFLLDFFLGDFKKTTFNFLHNGHQETIEQLLGRKVPKKTDFKQEQKELLEKYPHIYEMLENAMYFYEVDKYIFVHGGVDSTLEDWRTTPIRTLTWASQASLPPVKGKTVVCGHKQNVSLRAPNSYKDYLKYPESFPDMFKNLYLSGSIHIDGSVMATQKINVLVLSI